MEIVKFARSHWESARDIYEQGIAARNATFQSVAPAWDEWDKSHLPRLRFIATEDISVLGWAALSQVSQRVVYSGVAEVSVYVGTAYQGRGVGKALLGRLVDESEHQGYWTLQSGIFPENTASIRLHQACGFIIVGRREKIGKMDGRWRDTVLMERRSRNV